MHLALELDQSKQVSADPKKDLDLALTVLRKRIDEFGVEEPLVQKAGDDRIVVELAGHHRPGPRQGHRPTQRLPRVPDHRQDRSARQGAPARWTACCAASGIKGADRSAGKRSAVRAAARRRHRSKVRPRPKRGGGHGRGAGRRARRADPAGRRRGRQRGARRVRGAGDGLPPGRQPAQHPGGGPPAAPRARLPLVGGRRPASACSRTASSTCSTTGRSSPASNLMDAAAQLDPADQRADRHLRARPRRAAAGSATRPAGTSGDYMAILLDGRVQGRPPVIQSRIGRQRPDHAGQTRPCRRRRTWR